ncbi:MAG TPA: LytR C-terminal domain-containing protein [Longimicrobiales bacterium]
MSNRLRVLALIVVVLLVGAFAGSGLDRWWSAPPATGRVEAEIGAPPGVRVRVEVLNGGGREGMARAATDRLRNRGFDVVDWGNADAFDRDSSVVLDRLGQPELARTVADVLGIRQVLAEPDSNLYLDVSVVLGRDWAPAPDESDVAPSHAWWDVRRFFRTPSPGVESPPDGGRMADPGNESG